MNEQPQLSSVQKMPDELKAALSTMGLGDASAVFIVRPGDSFVAYVQDPQNGVVFSVDKGAPMMRVPAAQNGGYGEMVEVDPTIVMMMRSSSPATCVVCETVSGQKICWEEQC